MGNGRHRQKSVQIFIDYNWCENLDLTICAMPQCSVDPLSEWRFSGITQFSPPVQLTLLGSSSLQVYGSIYLACKILFYLSFRCLNLGGYQDLEHFINWEVWENGIIRMLVIMECQHRKNNAMPHLSRKWRWEKRVWETGMYMCLVVEGVLQLAVPRLRDWSIAVFYWIEFP